MLETISYIEETAPWYFPLVIFIFGACVGSFLNVCIFRMPKGESVLWPPSHASNGRRLSWWENIPILAWIYLRGKDRVTGEKYGFRYPMVEALTAVLFVVCWKQNEPIVALVGMLFVALLIVGTFVDLDHMILPDTVTIGGMIVGVFLSFWVPQLHINPDTTDYLSDGFAAGVTAIISALIGAGFVFWIGEIGEVVFRKPAMGLGDVKLVGCIGAFCGWQGAIFSLFGGAVMGCFILIPIMVFQRLTAKDKDPEQTNQPEKNEVESGPDSPEVDEEDEIGFGLEVPFGPMLALGGVAYFLGAKQFVDPYFVLVKDIVFGG